MMRIGRRCFVPRAEKGHTDCVPVRLLLDGGADKVGDIYYIHDHLTECRGGPDESGTLFKVYIENDYSISN